VNDGGPGFGQVIMGVEGPEAIARWLSERAGRPIRIEKVEPGHEQILEDQEQRDLDAVPSFSRCETTRPSCRAQARPAGAAGHATAPEPAASTGSSTRPADLN
jgi:hypothetical protein